VAPHQGRASPIGSQLERLAHAATTWTGSSAAFATAAGTVLAWAITGPWFHYSDTWQLVINTGTTIITFLMVFLIQRTQNKDSLAIHLKLNELIAVLEGASNRLINVEDLGEAEVRALHERYERLLALATGGRPVTDSRTIEDVAPADDDQSCARGTTKP
jgi:low affinity Fe/Cu permease